ncbi:MAG: hypothetical protein HY040_18645 [Planctomycetes bacterium]|nr:hypothetical protein [Planctomycetota bacterium]
MKSERIRALFEELTPSGREIVLLELAKRFCRENSAERIGYVVGQIGSFPHFMSPEELESLRKFERYLNALPDEQVAIIDDEEMRIIHEAAAEEERKRKERLIRNTEEGEVGRSCYAMLKGIECLIESSKRSFSRAEAARFLNKSPSQISRAIASRNLESNGKKRTKFLKVRRKSLLARALEIAGKLAERCKSPKLISEVSRLKTRAFPVHLIPD